MAGISPVADMRDSSFAGVAAAFMVALPFRSPKTDRGNSSNNMSLQKRGDGGHTMGGLRLRSRTR